MKAYQPLSRQTYIPFKTDYVWTPSQGYSGDPFPLVQTDFENRIPLTYTYIVSAHGQWTLDGSRWSSFTDECVFYILLDSADHDEIPRSAPPLKCQQNLAAEILKLYPRLYKALYFMCIIEWKFK